MHCHPCCQTSKFTYFMWTTSSWNVLNFSVQMTTLTVTAAIVIYFILIIIITRCRRTLIRAFSNWAMLIENRFYQSISFLIIYDILCDIKLWIVLAVVECFRATFLSFSPSEANDDSVFHHCVGQLNKSKRDFLLLILREKANIGFSFFHLKFLKKGLYWFVK